jgi:hypothetical protein
MIDIEQHQRERGAVASGTIHFLLQMLDQAATIDQSGQTIRGREASEFGVLVGQPVQQPRQFVRAAAIAVKRLFRSCAVRAPERPDPPIWRPAPPSAASQGSILAGPFVPRACERVRGTNDRDIVRPRTGQATRL